MARSRDLVLALLSLVLAAAPAAAQGPTGTVVGRLTEAETQRPLAGATVQVAGRGGISDDAGRFTITRVAPGTHTLTAQLIGYAETSRSVTVVAGQSVRADIVLATQVVQLGELVVTGYGTQKAGNISGAVRHLKTEEFNTGRIVSAEQLIQSKVAGVQVVDNNEPGGGLSLRIRGATSINAKSDPLFVIDGVSVGSGSGGGLSAGRNPMNFLNPDDVESVTVLKDAAAAAIYGANAANGVVIIQTKSGRRTLGVEYTGSVSGSTITRRPDMLNAAEFRTAVQTYAPQNATQLGNANTDWYDLVARDAMGQEHNLSVSNWTDVTSFRLSVGYLNQDGVIDGTTTERLSASLNLDQRLFDERLQVKSSIKGARNHDRFTPGGVLSNAAQMGPTQPVHDENTVTGYYDWPGAVLTSPDNPIAILDLASDEGTTYRSLGSLQADYRLPFMEALKASVLLGYDLAKATRETFTPALLHSQLKTGNGGTTYRRDDEALNTVLQTYLNYTAPLARLPGTIDLTAGYSYAREHGKYPWFQADGLSTDLLGPGGIPSARQVQNGLWIDESKLISFFGRANYNLNDKYLASVSVRRDGSSRFGPDNAWGTFPAFSLAWRISQEPFMANLPFSDLKLRGSWGRTGNQAFSNYQQFSTYRVGDAQSQVQFGNEFVTTMRPSAADPNIRWEETDSYNFGLDYGFMQGRVSGAIDYYQKETKDLIFTVPVAAGTNLSNYLTTNIGSMKNQGLEFTLSARVLEGGRDGLGWSMDFNAGHNSNELLTINPFGGGNQQILTGLVAGGVGTYIQVLEPGQPINSFFVYRHKREGGKPIYKDVTGLDSQGKFDNKPDGTINEQDLYEDLNGDGRINVDDRSAFNSPAPEWILGFSSYLNYHNFDMAFTLRSYLGNYVYNNVASNLGTYAEVGRGSPYNLHRSVLETGFKTPQYLSDYYVEDGSFLRMDNITLGYSFEYQGQPVRVFGSVQNAFTVTGYNGVDPTAGLNGLDNNIYPRSRTFAAGLNVRL